MTKTLAVLVSGTGSLLQSIYRAGLPIDRVIADRECSGIEFSRQRGLKTILRPRLKKAVFDRKAYTEQLMADLRGIDLVAMAGYMTILDPIIFTQFAGRILNIHPSLLPAFKGEKAVEDALTFGVKVTGTTIHYATAELDAGPIIEQECVRVEKDDTVATLHERIKAVERILYPREIQKLLVS